MRRPNNSAESKAIVLDTSALIAGLDPFSINEQLYTVPAVIQEIARNTSLRFRLKTAEENGRVRVITPQGEFLQKTREAAIQVGDAYFLSNADLQVLALALQLRANECSPVIATDDYSIQNVAKQMNVEFTSLATFGIRQHLQWFRYCPACHRIYQASYRNSKCQICGTELKRKPLRKNSIKQ